MTLFCNGDCQKEKFAGFFSEAEKKAKRPICMSCRREFSTANRKKYRPNNPSLHYDWRKNHRSLFHESDPYVWRGILK